MLCLECGIKKKKKLNSFYSFKIAAFCCVYVAVSHCHTHLQQRVNSVQLLTESPAVGAVRFVLSCFAAAVCQPKIQSQSI